MKERFYRGLNKFMVVFAKWFASPLGVLETFILTIGWVIVETFNPHLDPNGFFIMYIFTLYSGITQPVLAYSANMSAIEAEKNQELLVQLAKNNIDMMEAILSLMENQEKMLNKFDTILGSIAEDVEQIQDEIAEE